MVSCKSNKVLPHDGQDIYSVLVILVLLACNIPNEVLFVSFNEPQLSAAMHSPSPNPSMKRAPISVDEYNRKSDGFKFL